MKRLCSFSLTLTRLSMFCSKKRAIRKEVPTLTSKLILKDSPPDLLQFYKLNKSDYKPEHLSLTCRMLGKLVKSGSPAEVAKFKDDGDEFIAHMSQNIEHMDALELTDFLFMCRKICSPETQLPSETRKRLRQRGASLARYGHCTFKQLVSINYFSLLLGCSSQVLLETMAENLKSSAEEVRGLLDRSSMLNLIQSMSIGSMSLTYLQKTVLKMALDIFDSKYPVEAMRMGDLAMILAIIVQVQSVKGVPEYTDRLINRLEAGREHHSEKEIMRILQSAQNSNSPSVTDFARKTKDRLLLSLQSEDYQFKLWSMVRSLESIALWRQKVRFTDKQESVLVSAFRARSKYINHLGPSLWTLRMFGHQTARQLAQLFLKNSGPLNLASLAGLAPFIDISACIMEPGLIPAQPELIDLLRLQAILACQTKLTPQLQKLRTKNIKQMRLKADIESFPTFRIFFKETQLSHCTKVQSVVRDVILLMSPKQIAKKMESSEFKFVVIVLLRTRQKHLLWKKLHSKTNSLGVFKAFGTTISTITHSRSAAHLMDSFWEFVMAFLSGQENLLTHLGRRMSHLSIANASPQSKFLEYLNGSITNSLFIKDRLLALIDGTVQDCPSPVVRRILLQAVSRNIQKVHNVDKQTVLRLVHAIKLEGLLVPDLWKRIRGVRGLLPSNWKEFPLLAALDHGTSSVENLQPGTGCLDPTALSVILLLAFPSWQHLKTRVVDSITTSTFSLQQWRAVLTSLQPTHQNDKDYKQVSQLLLNKFLFAAVSNPRSAEYMAVLQQVLPSYSTKLTLEEMDALPQTLQTPLPKESSSGLMGVLSNSQGVGPTDTLPRTPM